MHIANSDKAVSFYSLDIVLAVGYRTNSSKAIKFRQWATYILKNYIQNGYIINNDKITNDRFKELEKEVILLKSKQGIFYDGQIFDAYVFVNNLLKLAKEEVVLIDNYIDETVFTIFSKYPNIKIKIYTKTITKQWFAFSKFDIQSFDILERVKQNRQKT